MGSAAPRAVTARELFGETAAPSSAAGRKHSTAHLDEPVTSRDLFGIVRGRCLKARRSSGRADTRRAGGARRADVLPSSRLTRRARSATAHASKN
jgi:hypothetical protein